MVRTTLAGALAVAALAAAGCGGGGGGSDTSSKDADGVKATYRQFITDIRDKKYADACSLMTPSAVSQIKAASSRLGKLDCPKILALVRRFTPDKTINQALDKADRLKVRVNGDTATVAPVRKAAQAAKLSYVDGHWKLDQPGG